MEVGSDSGCDQVLRNLQKGFTTKHVRKLHTISDDVGIPDCHTFILGTEGETIDDVKRTIEFVVDLDPHSAIINLWFDDYEALDPDLRKPRMQLRKNIEHLLHDHKNDYPHWSIPVLGINFDQDLFVGLRRLGLQGPLWQHMRPSRP